MNLEWNGNDGSFITQLFMFSQLTCSYDIGWMTVTLQLNDIKIKLVYKRNVKLADWLTDTTGHVVFNWMLEALLILYELQNIFYLKWVKHQRTNVIFIIGKQKKKDIEHEVLLSFFTSIKFFIFSMVKLLFGLDS